jgi:uncharacterized SAM-binding protein YcdF (DUF218 family)
MAVIWALLLPVLAVTILLYGQVDRAQQADVIVVLGAGLRADNSPGPALTRRSQHGAELWKQGFAPFIICTGGKPGRASRTEADACAELVREQGVPPDVIVLEGESRSTEENAIQTRAIMAARGWQTAIIVSDGFHLLRASWIFQIEGITAYTSPVTDRIPPPLELTLHVVREIVALHWQVLKQLFGLPITYVKSV